MRFFSGRQPKQIYNCKFQVNVNGADLKQQENFGELVTFSSNETILYSTTFVLLLHSCTVCMFQCYRLMFYIETWIEDKLTRSLGTAYGTEGKRVLKTINIKEI